LGITIGQLTAIITADSTQFETRMKSVSDLLNKASGDAGNTSQSISAMSVAIGNMVAQAANKIFDMGKSIIETGIKFDALKEQATVAFTTMLGSGQKAKAFLDDLAAFANKTPFEFPDLIRAAQKFTAMGVSAGKVIPTLTAVGDAVAAMGGGKEMIDRVSTALVQMSAKGKVSAEEMRQLAEAGIPAWDILAKKLGISVPEAMKKSEKGAIDATTAIDALVEGMESRFGGMMDKQALTFNGLLSTLHDTAVQMAGQMFEPIFEASKDVLSKIVSGLPAFQAEFAKAWNEIVKDAGFILSELKPTISNILSDIKTLWSSNQKDIINEVHTASSIVKTLWDSSMGGLLKIFSAGTAALTGNWTEAMNRIVAGTSLAGSKVMATIGRWIQALVTVSNLTGGLGSIANIFGKISGPAGDVKPDTFWKDATTALRAHTAAANQAAVEVPKALGAVGGAHKKAADESGKLLKEQVSAVNDWLKSTDSALSISETAWENAEQSVRTTLLKASDAFHKSIDDAQTWAEREAREKARIARQEAREHTRIEEQESKRRIQIRQREQRTMREARGQAVRATVGAAGRIGGMALSATTDLVGQAREARQRIAGGERAVGNAVFQAGGDRRRRRRRRGRR
jgi:tape measure domain-containing protein